MEWDDSSFERALERLATDGTIDASGARVSAERLARILEAAPPDPDYAGSRFLDARFDGSTFEGRAGFAHVVFGEGTSFEGATFEGDATFDWTVFKGGAGFSRATFASDAAFNAFKVEGDAAFDHAGFGGDVQFNLPMVEGAAGFDDATFGGATRFLSGSFEADASFRGATFRGDTQFFPAFEGAVRFDKARFEGAVFLSATFQHVGFYAATFEGAVTCFPALTCRDASFESATFAGARDLGPVLAEERLVLDRTVFAEPVRIEASAQTVSCARAQFRGGADLLVRRAEVTLDDADFGEPSLLAPRREPVPEEEPELSEEQAPRVLSLRRAKVANLTIAGADLSACRFEGAHGLDRLRLEQVRFAETPRGRRWTRRQVIAEEQQWRASGDPAMSPAPGQIAAIYRALRKGREDGKDEPGAADFYYGEMEMRRQRPRGTRDERRAAPAGERLVLWLYWLVSGYGLRASRALISLALTVLVFAFLFDWWGFRPDQGFGRTLLFSIESTSSLFRVPETRGFALTAAGELMQVALRLLGPLFFGLALFSLRGRVKR